MKNGVESLKKLRKTKTSGKNMNKIFGINMKQLKMRLYMSRTQVM